MFLLFACGPDVSVTQDPRCDGIQQTRETSVDSPFDADGDGYFDGNNPDCAATYDLTDCNDQDAAISPGAAETECNGIDEDCDPASADDPDADGDGVGACSDCDDADPFVAPGLDDVPCNGVDDDCDASTGDGGDTTLGTSGNPARSCADLLARGCATADAAYWIDPAGGDPWQAWCDLTTIGGGWTLAAAVTSDTWTLKRAASLDAGFVLPADDARALDLLGDEIRYGCTDGSVVVDVRTEGIDWRKRMYATGDGCSAGIDWRPDTSGFELLPEHTADLHDNPGADCCCREDHPLATYPIGFDPADFTIDDLYTSAVERMCAGSPDAPWMRVWYR